MKACLYWWCLLFAFRWVKGDESIPEGLTVGAYYYPWHAGDFHRNDGYMRELLEPKHSPYLGEYDDRRPEVIAQHLAWSRQANIKVWFASWWGPNRREDTTIRNNILTHPDLGDHKIALLYETTGRVRSRENYATDKVADDMRFICTQYFDHPNYLRIQGRPVVLLYLTRVMTAVGKLAEVVQLMRSNCDEKVFLIGDQVWGKAPGPNYAPFDLLDAVTNYDVYGNTNSPPYAGQDTVDKYYGRQAQWKQRANENGVGYIPAVSPGYNDRGVRLEADHIALSRKLTPSDEHGSLFLAQLRQARHLTDDSMNRLLLVNSFNEWHEDTQIEPVVGETTSLPDLYTNGVEYVGYGELYLNILREATTVQVIRDDDPIIEDIPLPDVVFPSGPWPSPITIGAFYIGWESPTEQNLRTALGQFPILADYSNPQAVIQKHLEWSKRANIDLWILPWRGPNHPSDQWARNELLRYPSLGQHKLALFYETPARSPRSEGWPLYNIASDIQYIAESFLHHPNYHRIQGKAVVFVSLTRLLYNEGALESIVGEMRNTASNLGLEVFLIGDQVWDDAPQVDVYLPFLELDAVFNRDVYGDIQHFTPLLVNGTLAETGLKSYYKAQLQWRDRAWRSNCSFVPSVTPGFNKKLDRPELAALSRSLLGMPHGSLFAKSVQMARHLVDSDVENLLVLNSFNQFDEDTQIEPVRGETADTPQSLTSGISYVGYEYLYLDILSDYTTSGSQGGGNLSITNSFVPLPCNSAINEATCQSWTSAFGSSGIQTEEVIIPCGKCISMDSIPGNELELRSGLDIQGRLSFPDGLSLRLSLPFVRVQGELFMRSQGSLDGQSNIHVVLKDPTDMSISAKFLPEDPNQEVCGAQRCDPGMNSVFVAGGHLDVSGIDPATKTVVPLLDVVHELGALPTRERIHEYEARKETCNFRMVGSRTTSSLGSQMLNRNGKLTVHNRRFSSQGAVVDLDGLRGCFEAGKAYPVHINIDISGEPTNLCSRTGEACLKVYVDTMYSNGQIHSQLVSPFVPSGSNEIDVSVTFSAVQLDNRNIYNALRIAGTLPTSNITILSLEMLQPPNAICAVEQEYQCVDLVHCNGDAEDGDSTMLFFSRIENDKIQINVEKEDSGNRFFRITRLGGSTLPISGAAMLLPIPCLHEEGAVYRVSFRVRIHYEDPSLTGEFAVYLKAYQPGPDVQERIGICRGVSSQWSQCELDLRISEAVAQDQDNEAAMIFFETVGTATATYDLDDLSIRFVHVDRPTTQIVLPESKWQAGAEILIASHTSSWQGAQVRRIVQVTPTGSGTYVHTLDQPIARPSTAADSSFLGVEVALLSRNIVFETTSGQGHLLIQNTRGTNQVLEGVEFRGFGNAQSENASPITIKGSGSQDQESRISKNTIRDSSNRCIVVEDVLGPLMVTENVAWNTQGDCFVVKQQGLSQGQVELSRNLGASTRFGQGFDQEISTFLVQGSVLVKENWAVGSEGHGFALKGSISGFESNVAHSNQGAGISVRDAASIVLESCFVSRNQANGIILQNISSLASIVNSVLIDQPKHVVVDTSRLALENVTLVFASYPSNCGVLVGVESSEEAVEWRNVHLSVPASPPCLVVEAWKRLERTLSLCPSFRAKTYSMNGKFLEAFLSNDDDKAGVVQGQLKGFWSVAASNDDGQDSCHELEVWATFDTPGLQMPLFLDAATGEFTILTNSRGAKAGPLKDISKFCLI